MRKKMNDFAVWLANQKLAKGGMKIQFSPSTGCWALCFDQADCKGAIPIADLNILLSNLLKRNNGTT